MKRILRTISMLVVAVFTFCLSFTIVGCKDEPVVKDKYTVIFDYNYEGAPAARAREVKADTRVVPLPDPSRTGYDFVAWCTDKEGKDEYDFTQKVNKDFTLYAGWVVQTPNYAVTFDFNYDGAPEDWIVDVKENQSVSVNSVPECPRLGYVYKGWYKDEQRTQEWNMSTDIVTEPITLYADYEYDPSVKRDEEGNIIYENVEIDLHYLWDWGNQSYLNSLINKFNYQYRGQIKVKTPNNLDRESEAVNDMILYERQAQSIYSIRADYYAAQDVYDFAGIEFNPEDYYSDAIRECYINGKLYTVPVMMSVPYFVYNTTMMEKYNRDNPLPSTFEKLKTLLLKVYEGEYDENTNASFVTVKTNVSDWTFKEMTSSVAFLQNDSKYLKYSNGKLINDWSEDLENNKAVIALNNMNDLFGVNGVCHGSGNGDFEQSGTIADVAAGRAFMGLLNSAMYNGTVPTTQGIGILPLSGLFADENSTDRNLIPVYNIGFQFHKSSTTSLTELAATAVFADFVSKNCETYVGGLWYPAYKRAAEKGLNPDTSANAAIKAAANTLKQVGTPDNFYSLDGCPVLKVISNDEAAEKHIVPMLKNTAWDREFDAAVSVSALRETILALLGEN